MKSPIERFERSIFFARDVATAEYFWDTNEVTIHDQSEYAVYLMYRDYEIERVADTFWQFIEACLHRGDKKLYDDPPAMNFRAG